MGKCKVTIGHRIELSEKLWKVKMQHIRNECLDSENDILNVVQTIRFGHAKRLNDNN